MVRRPSWISTPPSTSTSASPTSAPARRPRWRRPSTGHDVLVVMPTGAGKSLCYQLPALVRDDLTIVVSPLVSLMQDQVEALERRAPGAAGVINAQQDAAANADVLARARAGSLKLLYVAPERFSSPGFLEAIREVPIGLFVVDEAHCVSQWGHDFRPDYFRLADAARWLGAKALVASTATATPQVARDIVARLGLQGAGDGHDRASTGPTCSFAVVPCATTADKHARIAAALARGGRAAGDRLRGHAQGVRRAGRAARRGARRSRCWPTTRAWAAAERADGPAAVHGRRRSRSSSRPTRSAWASTRPTCGRSRTRSCPPSVEAYYQEAGRAGRDGAPARALLFAEKRDKSLHVFFIQRAEVGEASWTRSRGGCWAARGRRALRRRGVLPGRRARAGAGDRRPPRAGGRRAAGAVADGPRARPGGRGVRRAARRRCARTSAAEGQRARWRQYRAVWAFVEGDGCRRATILRHFGDPAAPAPRGAVLRRVRSVAGAGVAVARAGRAAQRRVEPAGTARHDDRRRRSSRSSGRRSRRSGARAWPRCCAAGRPRR